MAEIVRGGLQSVDHGQTEAAGALGMSRAQTLRRIVLPQAMRVIIPPTGNETISMLKTTSLVAVIGYFELITSVQRIYSVNFQTIPLLIVAAIWYLALTSVLSVGQGFLERSVARGAARGPRGRGCCHLRRTPQGSEGRPTTRPMVEAVDVHKRFGHVEVLRGHRPDGAAGEVSASSGRPAPASRPSCAASTTSRRSTRGTMNVDGELIGYRRHGDKLHELRESTSPSSAATSAWCSSGSTCSRT